MLLTKETIDHNDHTLTLDITYLGDYTTYQKWSLLKTQHQSDTVCRRDNKLQVYKRSPTILTQLHTVLCILHNGLIKSGLHYRVGTCVILFTMNWDIHQGIVFGLNTHVLLRLQYTHGQPFKFLNANRYFLRML